jgi:hypothetical protein
MNPYAGNEIPPKFRNRLNWSAVLLLSFGCLLFVWVESQWVGDLGLALVGIVLCGITAGFFVVRFIRDCIGFSRERDRFVKNARYFAASTLIVGITVIGVNMRFGHKTRIVLERSAIEKTLREVERKCSDPNAPLPSYAGRRVKWECADRSFVYGSGSGFLEPGTWGFASTEILSREKVAKPAFGSVWFWTEDW